MKGPKPLEVILVAIELDDTADACLRTGFELASVLGTSLAVVHCYRAEAIAPVIGTAAVVLPVDVKKIESDRLAEVQALVDASALPTVHVERVMVRAGNPAQEIVAFARELTPRFLVIGTHGRTFLARAFLGSVADKVIRTSPVPVIAVPRNVRERGIRCGDVMTDSHAIGTNATAAQAAMLMRDLDVDFLPVCDGDLRVVGVVTAHDLVVRALSVANGAETPVGALLDSERLVAAHPEDDVRVAEERMIEAHVPCLVVVDADQRLRGVMGRAA